MSHPKSIRVQRITGMAEETLFANPDELTQEEIFALLDEAPNAFTWEETEVITHYKVVENYA